jgi:3-oxoadipate enol-lactonase
VPKIACPTLVITTEGSGLASVDETRAWQQTIPGSELLVLPGDSFHVATTDAERCAKATLEFIGRRDPGA